MVDEDNEIEKLDRIKLQKLARHPRVAPSKKRKQSVTNEIEEDKKCIRKRSNNKEYSLK